MMMHQKIFTLEEATSFIPMLELKIPHLLRLKKEIATCVEKLRQKGIEARELFERANLDDPELKAIRAELEHVGRELNRGVDEIHSFGCMIKDLDLGLVDFLGISEEGQQILYCWQLGEPDIRFWHLPTEGFSARKPLFEGKENAEWYH